MAPSSSASRAQPSWLVFDSGKAEVKQEGLVVLGKVIEILKTVNDKSIRIGGHTDNTSIVGLLTQRYATNWDLSAAPRIDGSRSSWRRRSEAASDAGDQADVVAREVVVYAMASPKT